jgi:hypothetical protein
VKTGFDVIRRAFFYWQFLAAFVLPAWLFVGWGLFGGSGWGFVGLLVTAPIVFIALLVIALIVYARPLVRSSRMVSWKDVLLYLVLHGSVIGLGFFGPSTTVFVVLAVLTAIVGFWLTLWELVTDGARSMRETMDAFEQAAQPPGQRPPGVPPRAPGQGSTHQGPTSRPGDDPDVIIIHEVRD